MRLKEASRRRRHCGAQSLSPPTWTDQEPVESPCLVESDHRHMAASRLTTGSKWAPLLFSSLLLTLLSTSCLAQYRPNWPSPYVQREIFVLNLEDGYFGCQVNESTDFLQLFELSKLCDGIPQCFQGSDEVELELKCKDRSMLLLASIDPSLVSSRLTVSFSPEDQCHPKMSKCTNGVCLDNHCYCNDGFGGKGCDLSGE